MKFLIALLTLGLVGLNGCANEPVPVLSVGGNIWPGYEPLYLARDLGYFQDAPIHAVEFISSTQVIRAYRNRTIDAVCLTLDEALLLASISDDLRIVMVTDISAGADAIVGSATTTTMRQLQGRRIGVEDGALGAFFLARALHESGMNLDDVNIVPIQAQDHERAFVDGAVDAVVTFEPVRGKLLAQGGQVLFDSTQLPGEIVDVLAIRLSYLQQHPQVVVDLMRAWLRAQDYIGQSQPDALARMARREGIDSEAMRSALQGLRVMDRADNHRLLSGAPPDLLATMHKLADFMRDKKLLHGQAPVDLLVDTRALLQVGQ